MQTKNKFKLLVLSLLVVFMFSCSVYAASSSYSFNMAYRVVDGKENGEIHSLDSGIARINGYHETYYSQYPMAPKQDIHYTLVKDGFFGDNTINSIVISLDSTFSRSFGTIDAGKYYLQIWKSSIDYHHTRGSGTLSN